MADGPSVALRGLHHGHAVAEGHTQDAVQVVGHVRLEAPDVPNLHARGYSRCRRGTFALFLRLMPGAARVPDCQTSQPTQYEPPGPILQTSSPRISGEISPGRRFGPLALVTTWVAVVPLFTAHGDVAAVDRPAGAGVALGDRVGAGEQVGEDLFAALRAELDALAEVGAGDVDRELRLGVDGGCRSTGRPSRP
ncbi:MAG: hypothetical protein KatS3mg087_0858 [Patescibacteria group bacterium]|nr:MAG: hypothetical protein KatS3mg087_0858 [Patescibacteria group bacterium]